MVGLATHAGLSVRCYIVISSSLFKLSIILFTSRCLPTIYRPSPFSPISSTILSSPSTYPRSVAILLVKAKPTLQFVDCSNCQHNGQVFLVYNVHMLGMICEGFGFNNMSYFRELELIQEVGFLYSKPTCPHCNLFVSMDWWVYYIRPYVGYGVQGLWGLATHATLETLGSGERRSILVLLQRMPNDIEHVLDITFIDAIGVSTISTKCIFMWHQLWVWLDGMYAHEG